MDYKKLFSSNSQRTQTIKKNIIGSLFIKGCSILISLLLVPMTLGYVSSELYGIWLTLSSIMLWLNFFDVGFTLGLKNKLAEAIAKEDWQRGKSLVSTTYFMMVLIFVPLWIVLELAIPLIDWALFLNVDASYNDEIARAVHILVACFCLQMIVNVLTAVIAAFQKVALSSAFPVLGNFLSLIAIFLLTKLCPPSLVALACTISVLPILVIIIASFILYSNKFKIVAPSIRTINKSYIKELFGLGYKFFLIQIQVVVLYQSTNILISNVAGPNEVTYYNIAYKYLGIAMMIYTIFLSPLWPAFTDAYTKQDYKWMKNIYRKMSMVFMVSAIAVIGMMVISPFVYKIWIGEEVSIPIMMTIAVGLYMIIHSWDSLQVNMINGIGAVKLQTYITSLGLIVHIPLSLFLGKCIGSVGVVVSMILINVLYSTVFTIQINKLLNNKAIGFWKK
ncbi:MAG: oligosaccharide flippase family protein [Bacteroidaceae bacterium]|nr:oligosaccharide flippase family protein [Bacteroidaceae bacterium]